MPSRRALLASLGGVTALGVWQRRRLLRREDIVTLERIEDIEIHTKPDPVAPIITSDHVKTSYERARTHVEVTEEYLDDDTPDHVVRRIQSALDRFDDNPPDEQTDDAARESALRTYRLAVASSAAARGAVLDEDRNSPSEELREAHDALAAALDDAEPNYPGERLTRVVVQGGEADDLLASAASRKRNVPERHFGDSETVAWELVELSRVGVHDAERLVETLDGPSRTDELQSAFDALAERTERDVNAIDFSYDEDVRNHASDRWTDVQLREADPEDAADDERFARAVRDQAKQAAVAATLDAFTEHPSSRRLDEVDADPPADASDVVPAKRDAVDALADALEAVGEDPLGNQLLGEILRTIESQDRWIDNFTENVRSYDGEEWDERVYRAFLAYRGAALQAEAVPDVVEIVKAEARTD